MNSLELAETFSEISRRLYRADSVQSTLQEIVDLACKTVEPCDAAGLTIVRGRHIESPANTSDAVSQLDRLQGELRSGPCIQALAEHEQVYAPDLADDARWPEFGAAAVERGFRSLLSFRLFVEEKREGAETTMGALNLYSAEVDAFHDEAHHIGAIFASHAAVALASARTAEKERQGEHDLREALASRDIIGQAKGMLMARQGITDEEAFDILRRVSQRTNQKLRDVAQDVVDRQRRPRD